MNVSGAKSLFLHLGLLHIVCFPLKKPLGSTRSKGLRGSSIVKADLESVGESAIAHIVAEV